MGLLIGTDLTAFELRDLETRWINRVMAEAAGLRHVDHFTGKDLVGGSGGGKDYEGIAIPYYLPGMDYPITWRLRRKNPEIDGRNGKPKGKYLSAPSDRNHIYFPRGTRPEDLIDASTPVIITEGEFKAIALRRLAMHEARTPRFLVIALSGVWNFRGTVGATTNENGVRVPVKGIIPELEMIKWAGRQVIIAFDCDKSANAKVRAARWALSVWLREHGANVGYLEWEEEQGNGPDDWLANVGPDVVLAAVAKVDYNTATGWQARLLCTDTGKPKALTENARIVLEYALEFAGLTLDEFSQRIVRPASLPWQALNATHWGDTDTLEFTTWLQRHHIEIGKDSAADDVRIVAAHHRFHPVRQYLEGLEWDGEPREDNWLNRYVGVQPSNYSSAVGRCWLVSAVARILRPGCKADVALMLVGPQRRGKSTVCRILGEPWFSDNMPNISQLKEAQLHLLGHWIIELAEMEALSKSEMSAVKAWLSRQEDIYRELWGKHPIHKPRECVFVATVNEGEPLKDSTGNERWWPVDVGTIDTDALRADKDQIWAEAVELFRAGTLWHLTDERILEEARREQANKLDLHVWHERIQQFCLNRELVTVAEILEQAIRKEPQHQTQADKMGIVRCLQTMRWKPGKRRINGESARVYVNPEWSDTKEEAE